MTLPNGWVETTIADVAKVNPKHASDTDREQTVSFVPMPAVDEHLGAIVEPADRMLDEIWKGFTHFAEGDVIFAKITPCMENGKAAVARSLTNGLACGSTEFYVLRPDADIQADYLWRFLRQRSYRSDAERHMTGAVGQRRVPRQYLERSPLPLPPAAEQRRIVAKLDALTARLARARAELDRVPVLTARLREGVLNDALEGRLTADRQEVWEPENIADIQSCREAYLRKRRGSRLKKISLTVGHLDGLRQGWLDCTLADVIELRVGYAFKSSDFEEHGTPLVRGANVAPGNIDWSDRKCLSNEKAKAYDSVKLATGDIVLAMDRPIISSGLKIARLTSTDNGALLVQRVANPRPTKHICAEFLYAVLKSPLLLRQIDEHSTGSDLPHISGNDILTTPCPLPPLPVQRELATAIATAFARADRMETEAARARALIDRLEAAILGRAFRGELVPQDPNDEPASVLLKRIRADRAAAPKPKRGLRAKAG